VVAPVHLVRQAGRLADTERLAANRDLAGVAAPPALEVAVEPLPSRDRVERDHLLGRHERDQVEYGALQVGERHRRAAQDLRDGHETGDAERHLRPTRTEKIAGGSECEPVPDRARERLCGDLGARIERSSCVHRGRTKSRGATAWNRQGTSRCQPAGERVAEPKGTAYSRKPRQMT
jgi:hypothetical protein